VIYLAWSIVILVSVGLIATLGHDPFGRDSGTFYDCFKHGLGVLIAPAMVIGLVYSIMWAFITVGRML
jgi:hypothetical protein